LERCDADTSAPLRYAFIEADLASDTPGMPDSLRYPSNVSVTRSVSVKRSTVLEALANIRAIAYAYGSDASETRAGDMKR
jgi:hypothetical protein